MTAMNSDDFDRDPALTLQLRSLLRPPADAAYWDGLETRIMDRILADGATAHLGQIGSGGFAAIMGWWEPFAQWTRIGRAVAAAVLVLTMLSLWKTAERDDRLAYEAAVEALATPLDSAGRPLGDGVRDKTVSDLFRY